MAEEVCAKFPTAGPGHNSAARNILRTVRALADASGDPRIRALSERREGTYLIEYRGLHGRGRELIQKSIDYFSKRGEALQEGISLSIAMVADGRLGNIEGVKASFERAHDLFEERDDKLRTTRLEINYGSALTTLARFEEARVATRSALSKAMMYGEALDRAVCEHNMGLVEMRLGRLSHAERWCRRAELSCEEAGIAPESIGLESSRGLLAHLAGDFSTALRLFRKTRSTPYTSPHTQAHSDLDEADALLDLGFYRESAQLASEAVDRFEEIGVVAEAARSQHTQARASLASGHVNAALDLALSARRTLHARGAERWCRRLDLLIADALARLGDGESASEILEQLVPTRREGSPDDDVQFLLHSAELRSAAGDHHRALELSKRTLESHQIVDSPLLEARALLALGRSNEALGNRADALKALLASERTYYRIARRLGAMSLRSSFTANNFDVYELLFALSWQNFPELAFETAESAKTMRYSIVDSPGHPPQKPTARNLHTRVGCLTREHNALGEQTRQAELNMTEDDRPRVLRLRAKRKDCDRKLRTAIRDLDAAHSSPREPGRTHAQAVRRALPKNSDMLSFFLAKGQVFCTILSRDRLKIVELCEGSLVRKVQERLSFSIARTEHCPERADPSTEHHLAQLSELLLRDLMPSVKADRLVIVPHGPLRTVPFHALPCPSARRLGNERSVSYVPSAALLVPPPTSAPSRRTSLVLAVPDSRAPAIVEEAESVAEYLPNPVLLVGTEATRVEFARQAPRASYIHIATHGFHRQENPLFSSLELGDGPITAYELLQERLRAELVVFSGCATGRTSFGDRDNVLGFAGAALAAGARSAVASMWAIDDETTLQFMKHFYGRLTSGRSKDCALAESSRAVRLNTPHPYHWAPFFLLGHPDSAAGA